MKTITVAKNDSGQRLDKFMKKKFKTMPEPLLYKYLRKKCVRINGTRITAPDYFLHEGDILTFYISDEFFESEPQVDYAGLRPSFSVVYEDENVLLVNKPIGLLCQNSENEARNTLINQIKAYLIQKDEYDPIKENTFAPALCNRIDKNTQGLVIAAKNAEALRILNQKIKDREIDKFYECLVFGQMEKEQDILIAYLKNCLLYTSSPCRSFPLRNCKRRSIF